MGVALSRKSRCRLTHASRVSAVPSGGPFLEAPLFDVCGMLVHADRGAVHDLQIAIIGRRNSFENAVPHAYLAPSYEAIVASRGWAIALRDVGPGRASAQAPIDAVQDLAVIGGERP